MAYADDLDLIGDRRHPVIINMQVLLETAKKVGLQVSEEKTEYMIITRSKKGGMK